MIAFIYLCTGSYVKFFERFYTSVTEKFMPGTDKRFFVLTDRVDEVNPHENVEVVKVDKESRVNTFLHRYSLYASLKNRIAYKFDYVFSCNANMRVDSVITPSEVLPDADIGQNMVCVSHLQFKEAFSDDKCMLALQYNTERNPESNAYIATIPYNYCFAGALTGGVPHAFFDMCFVIDKWQKEDSEKGITPIWHDESYFNKYRLLFAQKFRILPISFGMPELEYGMNIGRKMTILEKRLHGVHES